EPTDVSGDHFRDACDGGPVPADAPPTIAALLGDRAPLVAAIDTAVPAGFVGDLQSFLTSASVALVGGAVPAPFVDADHDKLADIDALGRFVDARGAAI